MHRVHAFSLSCSKRLDPSVEAVARKAFRPVQEKINTDDMKAVLMFLGHAFAENVVIKGWLGEIVRDALFFKVTDRDGKLYLSEPVNPMEADLMLCIDHELIADVKEVA